MIKVYLLYMYNIYNIAFFDIQQLFQMGKIPARRMFLNGLIWSCLKQQTAFMQAFCYIFIAFSLCADLGYCNIGVFSRF